MTARIETPGVGDDGKVPVYDETTGNFLLETPSGGGGSSTLDGLTDVVITAAASGDILRHNGTNWVDTPGTTHFDAAGTAASAVAALSTVYQPLDADLTAIAALTTTATGRSLLAAADAAAIRTIAGAETSGTAASAVSAHEADTTSVHGISNTANLLTTSSGIDALADVTITGASAGQVIKYNGSAWVNDTDSTSGGTSALDDLSDVVITAAASGDILRHNGTNWVDTPGTTHFDAAGTAASAVAAHEADTTSVHGIADTSALVTTSSAPELIRDTMATALVAGSNVTITVNDGADTITIAASGGGGSSGVLPLIGRWATMASAYAVPGVTLVNGNNAAVAMVADTLYYAPFLVDEAITMTDVALSVSTAAGTVLRIGIVKLDTDGQPLASGGLMWQDATLSPASTGQKTLSGLSVALAAGLYAQLLVCDGAASLRVPAVAQRVDSHVWSNSTVASNKGRSKASVGTSTFSDPVPDSTASSFLFNYFGMRWT